MAWAQCPGARLLAMAASISRAARWCWATRARRPRPPSKSILATSYQHNFAAGSAKIFSSTAAANGLTLGWADNGSNAVTVMATVPGDANLDGRVDINDLTVVLTSYGATGAIWSQGDFNYDGQVDINDLTVVLTDYGRSLGASAALSAVPEPSCLVLLGVGAITLLACAWRRQTWAAWPR